MTKDLSPEWLELSSRVRALADKQPGSELADEATKLCDHFERLHFDVETLLGGLDQEVKAERVGGPLETLPTPPPEKVDQANLQIQKEMHQESDLQHIIKALFMWKDDPVQRVREPRD